jgi:hypothetical protein
MNTAKRNWKEWYLIIILLLIGGMYLALQLTSMIHSYSRSSSIEGDTITISKSELLTDIRTFVTVILCLAAAVGLMLRKTFGWVTGISIYIIFLFVTSGGWINAINMQLGPQLVFLLVITVLLLLAIFILVSRPIREKFAVNRKHLISAGILTLCLAAIYFLLQ